MVPLTSRWQYLQQLGSDHHTQAFVDFLLERDVAISSPSYNETADDIATSALRAIQHDDPEGFDEAYDQIQRRKPKSDSDWIYNDLLLFALTVGVGKFNHETEWLQNVLRVRMESTDGEKRLITQTLLDAVERNFQSIGNHKSLMIVIKHFLFLSLGSEDHVGSTYREVVESPFPLHESAFLNAISLRAVDIIVFHKELGSIEWYRATDRFLGCFRTRVRQLAWSLWILVLIVVGSATLYFYYYFFTSDPSTRDILETAVQLLPPIGLTSLLAPVIAKHKQIRGWFERRLLRFFKYRVPERNRSVE